MKRSAIELNKPEKKTDNKKEIAFALNIEKVEQQLSELFPIGLIPRSEIERATGGILCARTMSNADSRKDGIGTKVYVGKKICYPINDVIEYIVQKMKQVDKAA